MNSMRGRIRLISVCILLFACMLFVKLYSVQIIHSDEFIERADRQYQRPANAFNRGTIYFSDRENNIISAATLKTGFILVINPKILQTNKSIDEAYNKLVQVIPANDLNYNDFYVRASKPGDTYEEIKKQIDEELGTQINELKIPGVSLLKDKWRYYPGGTLASHLLGFMAFKENDLAGRYGLERFYENVLRRENDNVYVNFFAELFSNFKKTVENGGQLEGDVITNIEPRTQAYLETALKDISRQYSSEKTGGIILNPQTGEVYAMALSPTFDPNNFKDANVNDFKNDIVESVYEMGSIIKPLTLAVGIDLGKVNASSTYNDTGSVTSDGRTIYNFDKKGRGTITLQYALSKSLNTAFAYIVGRTGNKALGEYFEKFGLGEKTGIDLPNEGNGLISNLKSPRDIEYITASFGQGIAVTPIEVARAFSAIANGGKLITPHIAKKIQYRVGINKEIDGGDSERVMKESTAKQVANMMVYNVDHSLLDGKAMNPRYSIAAKTGTAQIAENGKYAEDRFLHSFVGFLPASDPKFVVMLYTVNPRGVSFASETLAKPFMDMTKFLINYYQLPPDR